MLFCKYEKKKQTNPQKTHATESRKIVNLKAYNFGYYVFAETEFSHYNSEEDSIST